MPLDVKIHCFFKADILGQAFDGGNVVTDGNVQFGVGFPRLKFLHGAHVVASVMAFELEGFDFAIGNFGRRSLSFLSGFLQVGEFLTDALRTLIVGERVDITSVFNER